jgi:L-aspartate oxidase
MSGWELQNLLLVSGLITRAALMREESRGVHLRTDFPNLDDHHWKRHLTFVTQ